MSEIALVCANVILASIAIFQKWGFYYVLLVFWIEALIIGFYNLARITVSFLFGNPIGVLAKWIKLPFPTRFFLLIITAGFFVTKFGGCAIGLGLIILMMPIFLTLPAGQTHHVDLFEGIKMISPALGDVGPELLVAVTVLFLSHGISFILNYIKRQEYKRDNILKLLFLPYARMFLVSVVVALGLTATVAVPSLNRMTVFSVSVILLKLFADLLSHIWEHKAKNSRELDVGIEINENLT